MSATTVLNSCLVTYYYAEKSSSDYIYASLGTTLGDLRDQIHTKVKSTLEVNWGERDAIHPNSAAIMISASKKEPISLKMHRQLTDSTTGTHGSNEFTDDSLTIRDLCTVDDHIYAIIPSKPSVELPPNLAVLGPAYLTEPLLDKTANSK
jgi:hypothetical protein